MSLRESLIKRLKTNNIPNEIDDDGNVKIPEKESLITIAAVGRMRQSKVAINGLKHFNVVIISRVT
jgi:hypothetical protein